MKTKLYQEILSAVERATEIDRVRILSRDKSREVVEARSLLFHYLYAAEFSRQQIADITGLTRQCVAAKIQAFPDKNSRSKWLTAIMQEVDNIRATK
jgi:CRP-like cAMP-binding protein